jgi:hypothetical protein
MNPRRIAERKGRKRFRGRNDDVEADYGLGSAYWEKVLEVECAEKLNV